MGKIIMGFVLNTVTLSTLAGSKIVIYPPLAFAKVLQVSRSGIIHDIINSTPGNRQVRISFVGKAFSFAAEFNNGETITVKWKT